MAAIHLLERRFERHARLRKIVDFDPLTPAARMHHNTERNPYNLVPLIERKLRPKEVEARFGVPF